MSLEHLDLKAIQFNPVVIVGPPASGKTTLVREISKLCDLPASLEIGGKGRAYWGGHWTDCDNYDEYAMLSEFANDILISHLYPGKFVLLEQWHLGNMAFSMRRKPETYRQYLQEMQRYYLPDSLLCIRLRCDIDLLTKRSNGSISKPVLEEAVSIWDASLSEVINCLGIRSTTLDSGSIDDTIRIASNLFSTTIFQKYETIRRI